jgi:hypothetical protein
MRLGHNRRQISRRATAIASVLALVVTGSGQAFQAGACPSHNETGAAARHAEQAIPSHAAHAHEVDEQAAGLGSHSPHEGSVGEEAPDTEHGNHACTCVGDCCQNALTECSASRRPTLRLGFRVPLALQITDSFLPAPAQYSYVLPFATPPPTST